LKENLIDELVITVMPVLLGAGSTLLGDLSEQLNFECVATKHFLVKIAQSHFLRRRLN